MVRLLSLLAVIGLIAGKVVDVSKMTTDKHGNPNFTGKEDFFSTGQKKTCPVSCVYNGAAEESLTGSIVSQHLMKHPKMAAIRYPDAPWPALFKEKISQRVFHRCYWRNSDGGKNGKRVCDCQCAQWEVGAVCEAFSGCPTDCGIGQTKQPGTREILCKFHSRILGNAQCIKDDIPNSACIRKCPATDPCPVDCVGQWSELSSCSVSCGAGSKTRRFTVTTPAQHGGVPCPVADGATHVEACNEPPCCIERKEIAVFPSFMAGTNGEKEYNPTKPHSCVMQYEDDLTKPKCGDVPQEDAWKCEKKNHCETTYGSCSKWSWEQNCPTGFRKTGDLQPCGEGREKPHCNKCRLVDDNCRWEAQADKYECSTESGKLYGFEQKEAGEVCQYGADEWINTCDQYGFEIEEKGGTCVWTSPARQFSTPRVFDNLYTTFDLKAKDSFLDEHMETSDYAKIWLRTCASADTKHTCGEWRLTKDKRGDTEGETWRSFSSDKLAHTLENFLSADHGYVQAKIELSSNESDESHKLGKLVVNGGC